MHRSNQALSVWQAGGGKSACDEWVTLRPLSVRLTGVAVVLPAMPCIGDVAPCGSVADRCGVVLPVILCSGKIKISTCFVQTDVK